MFTGWSFLKYSIMVYNVYIVKLDEELGRKAISQVVFQQNAVNLSVTLYFS